MSIKTVSEILSPFSAEEQQQVLQALLQLLDEVDYGKAKDESGWKPEVLALKGDLPSNLQNAFLDLVEAHAAMPCTESVTKGGKTTCKTHNKDHEISYNFRPGELIGKLLEDLKKKAASYNDCRKGVHAPRPMNDSLDLYIPFAGAAKDLYDVILQNVGDGKTVVVRSLVSGENLEIRTVGDLKPIDQLMFSSTRNSENTNEVCLMSQVILISVLEDCEKA